MSTVTAGNVVSTGTITGANITASGTLSAATLSVTSLGVNTASPAAALDVNGAGRFVGDSALTLSGATAQYPTQLSIAATAHATSRRSAIAFENWAIGQDSNGNGTKDFFLYDGNASASRLNISNTGVVTVSNSLTVSTNTLNLGTSSISANGYSRLPNGLLLQWGTSASINQDSSGTVTFPVAFTTLYNIQITGRQNINTGSGGSDTISAQSTTQFTIAHGADGTSTFYWMAIGV